MNPEPEPWEITENHMGEQFPGKEPSGSYDGNASGRRDDAIHPTGSNYDEEANAELSEALIELSDLSVTHGPDSRQVGRFIEEHRQIDEFEEYARAYLLAMANSKRRGTGAPMGTFLAGVNWPKMVSYALAASASVACVFGIYSIIHWANMVSNRAAEEREHLERASYAHVRQSPNQPTKAEAYIASLQKDADQAKANADRAKALEDVLTARANRINDLQRETDRLQTTLADQQKAIGILSGEQADSKKTLRRLEVTYQKAMRSNARAGLMMTLLSLIHDVNALSPILRDGRDGRIVALRRRVQEELARMQRIEHESPKSLSGVPDLFVELEGFEMILTPLIQLTIESLNTSPLNKGSEAEPSDGFVVSVALLGCASNTRIAAMRLRESPFRQEAYLHKHLSTFAESLDKVAEDFTKAAFDLAPPGSSEAIRKLAGDLKAFDDKTRDAMSDFTSALTASPPEILDRRTPQ